MDLTEPWLDEVEVCSIEKSHDPCFIVEALIDTPESTDWVAILARRRQSPQDLNKKSKKVDTAMDNVITNAERGRLQPRLSKSV